MTRLRTDLSNMTEEQRLEHKRMKAREKAARWRAANGDKHRATEKARYWADPETARAKNRERLRAHPEYNHKRRAYNAEWHRRKRAENPEWEREKALRLAYGPDVNYDQRLLEQGGHCALCSRTPDQEHHGVLHVDHDHSSGKVRALLCSNHNTALGLFADDPTALRAAADYIERFSRT